MPLAPGSRLGPYEVLAPLGAGGMGEVYRGRDTKLEREVAIKVLPGHLTSDPDALLRFEREAKVVAALSHPNILSIFDFGAHDGVTYAVTELLEGETLRQRLAEGPLPLRKGIEVARGVALGLAAAHEKGIIHRDLKPENLFLTKDGHVKILDFGLARQLVLPSTQDTHSPTLVQATEPGTVLGTVGYMAPEQLRGQPADLRSDIFSLGAVLYESLTGRRAFLGESAVETMNAILKEEPPEVSQSGVQIPPGLERIVSHCLEKRPDDRFQSARDLAFDLGALSALSGAVGAARTLPAASRWPRKAAFALSAAIGLALAFWAGGRIGSRKTTPEVRLKRLTFRRGNLLTARFASDGQTVVYGAAWEGKPAELFAVRTDSAESRPLGLDHADVLSVSSKGELAVLLRKGSYQSPGYEGTLARVPLGGGATRELQEGVFQAQWAPDGENLAVTRLAPSGKIRLEYPLGHAIEESFFLSRTIAMSPRGDEIAILESDTDNRVAISILDSSGHKRQLTKGLRQVNGFAWSRLTGEVLYVGGREPGDTALRAVSISGRERIVWPGTTRFILHDVATDGRLLVERTSSREGVIWKASSASQERDLGWLDGTSLGDVSRDGTEILFSETGDGSGQKGGVYLRRTDGSPAVRLGDGAPMNFSPDGKWVLTLTASAVPEIVLLPTGPGLPRRVPVEGLKPLGASFIGDGRRIAAIHSAPGEPLQLSVVGIEGGRPTAIPLPSLAVHFGGKFSPDGARIAYVTTEHSLTTVPISGGTPTVLPGPGLAPDEYVSGWSGDGRFLFAQTQGEVPARVSRIDLQTGARSLWKEVQPSDPSGVITIGPVRFTADGTGYAYSYSRVVSSDLYVVEGLN